MGPQPEGGVDRRVFDAVSVRAQARRLRSEAEAVRKRSRDLLSESARIVEEIRITSWPAIFEVSGVVEGENVRARWEHGSLRLSPSLRQRGSLLMALGESFSTGEVDFEADLSSALPALLTVLRACDRVAELRVCLGAST